MSIVNQEIMYSAFDNLLSNSINQVPRIVGNNDLSIRNIPRRFPFITDTSSADFSVFIDIVKKFSFISVTAISDQFTKDEIFKGYNITHPAKIVVMNKDSLSPSWKYESKYFTNDTMTMCISSYELEFPVKRISKTID